MSELSMVAQSAPAQAFNRRSMLLIVAVGALAFVAMLVLGAYAPELRSGSNGGAHALSNAATGYSALVRLAEQTGRNPRVVRTEGELEGEALLVITPERPEIDLTDILDRRESMVTLIVLPKWQTQADPRRPGWVHSAGLLPPFVPEGVLSPQNKLAVHRGGSGGDRLRTVPRHAPQAVRFAAPSTLQTMNGAGLTPVLADRSGRVVLGQLSDTLYVLADPDLLNNQGMADRSQAAAALALLDFLNSTDATEIVFDVTVNGLGATRSPLRLAFDPPFLAVTLAIAAALALAALQAIVRFGSPLRPERAIPFGKAALVENSAALVRMAGREGRLGSRYAALIRDRAARLLRLPLSLQDELLDARLDALGARRPFSALAVAASGAERRDEMLAAAQELHQWFEEVKA